MSTVLDRIVPWLRRRLARRPRLQVEHVCDSKLRLGSAYGGWWVCASYLNRASTVYSVGVGTDVSFDMAIIKHFGVMVHAFDPTPQSIAWVHSQTLPPQFVMHEIGIADHDGCAEFYVPRGKNHVSHSLVRQSYVSGNSIEVQVARLTTVMRDLGHTELDVLKIDIEGAEYPLIEALLREQVSVRQLLVEFHHRFMPGGRKATERAARMLRSAGYRLFAMADSREECSFMRIA